MAKRKSNMEEIYASVPSLLYYDPSSPTALRWISGNGKRVRKDEIAGTRSGPYYRVRVMGEQIYAHRIVMLLTAGMSLESSFDVDHIDRNRLNNNKENLRAVSHHHNGFNLAQVKKTDSGISGVNRKHAHGNWEARIKFSGNTIHLGTYCELWDAICARCSARNKYHVIVPLRAEAQEKAQ